MLRVFEFMVGTLGRLFNLSLRIGKHNGEDIFRYPENKWNLIPFPSSKGVVFNSDNLATVNRHSFIVETRFAKALYMAESRWLKSSDEVRDISWRLHTFIWAVGVALRSHGTDAIFVECGTGKGYMAAGAASYYNFEDSGPDFYLVDVFQNSLVSKDGIESISPAEFAYTDNVDEVKKYFDRFPSIKVIKGLIPPVLSNIPNKPISFLHIDLNNSDAEEGALQSLKNRLCSGSVILFDDYGGFGGSCQAIVHQRFAKDNNRELLVLPTGQAVIIW
jgi:O-methyltransferase